MCVGLPFIAILFYRLLYFARTARNVIYWVKPSSLTAQLGFVWREREQNMCVCMLIMIIMLVLKLFMGQYNVDNDEERIKIIFALLLWCKKKI